MAAVILTVKLLADEILAEITVKIAQLYWLDATSDKDRASTWRPKLSPMNTSCRQKVTVICTYNSLKIEICSQ
jgi:hypothetical protein